MSFAVVTISIDKMYVKVTKNFCSVAKLPTWISNRGQNTSTVIGFFVCNRVIDRLDTLERSIMIINIEHGHVRSPSPKSYCTLLGMSGHPCRDINARPRYRRSHRKQLAGRPYGKLLQDYASPAYFFGEDCDNSAHLFEGQWQPRSSLSTPKKWAGLEHSYHCRTIIQPDSHYKYN